MDAITKVKTAKENKTKKHIKEQEVLQKSESINNEPNIIIENIKERNEEANDEQIEGNKSNLGNSTECNLNTNKENVDQLDGTNQMRNGEDIIATATESNLDAKLNEEELNTSKPQTVELKIITTTILPAPYETNVS